LKSDGVAIFTKFQASILYLRFPLLRDVTNYRFVVAVVYPGIFFGVGGGFNKFSWGQRTERTGIWWR